MYSNEIKVKEGCELGSDDRESVIIFTTKRCASTFLGKIIPMLNERALKLIHLDYEKYRWYILNKSKADLLFKEEASDIARKKGFLYAPLREYVEFPCLCEYRILLILRDPRDLLTSDYYSRAYSHGLPGHPARRREYKAERLRVRELTIDQYAVEFAPVYKKIYSDYCKFVLPNSNVTLLRYEDFADNLNQWLAKLEEGLRIMLDDETKESIAILKGDGKEIVEDPTQHVRKGKPGDHRSKLRLETIDHLNSIFEHELKALGYARDISTII